MQIFMPLWKVNLENRLLMNYMPSSKEWYSKTYLYGSNNFQTFYPFIRQCHILQKPFKIRLNNKPIKLHSAMF